nr:reverse transcriptase domain-containing protein [Tanacetum cinerariifolium]
MTPPPLTKEHIEGHVSALKSLVKDHKQSNKTDPIRLNFKVEDAEVHDQVIVKGKEVVDEDLRKPFKEAQRTPLTYRIIDAVNSGEWPMPVWCRMFQQTLDGSARGWFERLPRDNINEWADLKDAFAARYSVRRACFKEPHKITKIVRKSKESLIAFKERLTVETVTVNEMMERLYDFVRSKEAYANTELLKGEAKDSNRKMYFSLSIRDNRSYRNTYPGDSPRNDYRNNYRGRDAYPTSRARDYRAPYPPPRGEYNNRVAPVLTLDSLTKHPKEILATKRQLHLLVPLPMLNPLRSGNVYRYCDYHQEKGHYTNYCIQLRKQLEMALESGKPNHLLKDVRQRGRGSHGRDAPQPPKIINVISVNSVKDKNQKAREATKSWMNTPISFPVISSEYIFDEPLTFGAEVEGYLVRRVYVDEGFSVEVIRTSMKFIVVRAPSPYNVILGRPRLKTFRAIPSTNPMMKFPTPKGVATLVTWTVIIAECRRLEKKQMIEESSEGEKEVPMTEE